MTYQHSSQTKITIKNASQGSTGRREVICDLDYSRRVDCEFRDIPAIGGGYDPSSAVFVSSRSSPPPPA